MDNITEKVYADTWTLEDLPEMEATCDKLQNELKALLPADRRGLLLDWAILKNFVLNNRYSLNGLIEARRIVQQYQNLGMG